VQIATPQAGAHAGKSCPKRSILTICFQWFIFIKRDAPLVHREVPISVSFLPLPEQK
jgi:hypothetical protein